MYAFVTSSYVKKSKNKSFWQGDIRTTEGNFLAVIWEGDAAFLERGEVVRISSFKDQRDTKYHNIAIKAYDKIPKNEVPPDVAEILFAVPKVSNDLIEASAQVLFDRSYYDDQSIADFVVACLKDIDLKVLIDCPAATKMHHNYRGGLVVHTAEVFQIARAISNALPYKQFINTDVIKASATLHDIGKTITYFINEVGLADKKPTENVIGHLYYSMRMVEDTAKHQAIDKQILDEILHNIAAHHGRTDQGTIKEPKSLEALIVHQADHISAKAGEIDTLFMNNERYPHEFVTTAIKSLVQDAAN